MIPQRAEILPRSVGSGEATPIGKGILLPLDQTGNHFLGIKDLSKPLNGISGEIRDQWSYMTHLTAARYPFESLLSPFGRGNVVGGREGYGAFDFSLISGARRKNATRETTSPLKVWLHEHRKNPYPTKGEKIMLAILTKMTLTQISTWFANARRRLKKDNKMTWSPRNKSSDKRDSLSKSSKHQTDDTNKSISSNDDEDCMDTDENDQCLFDKDKSKVEDTPLCDDVFSEDDPGRDEKNAVNKLEKDEVIVGCNSLSQLSQDNVLKKINFAGNNSPVGNLQRWVDGHFGNQSPIDFPRELTPPRTPVEDIVSPGLYAGKENHRSKEKLHAVIQDVDSTSKHQENACKGKACFDNSFAQPDARSKRTDTQSCDLSRSSFSSHEELVTALAPNEFGLQKQFRSCGLTSHREIDAVLALTSLASR